MKQNENEISIHQPMISSAPIYPLTKTHHEAFPSATSAWCF